MRKPTGYIATCQCGLVTGAMDAVRTDLKDAGKLLGGWLSKGCTVSPVFDGTWSVKVEPCACSAAQQTQGERDGQI